MKIIRLKDGFTWAQFFQYANFMEKAYWENQGYTTILNPDTGLYELVGKNSATKQDQINRARTVKWADVEVDDQGKEYLYSYGNWEIFKDWVNNWAAAKLPDIFTEEELPN